MSFNHQESRADAYGPLVRNGRQDGVVSRRLALGAVGAGLTSFSVASRSQQVGGPPIKLIVQAPPGGTLDLAARNLQEPLGRALQTTIVVENKGGENGVAGTEAVLAAKSDGLTLLVAFSGYMVMTPHLVKLRFDPMRDLHL